MWFEDRNLIAGETKLLLLWNRQRCVNPVGLNLLKNFTNSLKIEKGDGMVMIKVDTLEQAKKEGRALERCCI